MATLNEAEGRAGLEAAHGAVRSPRRRRALPPGENILAETIRTRRRQLGMSQDALAGKMGVSRSLVGHWEQAKIKVSADDLERLALALDVTRSYLVGEAPLPNTSAASYLEGIMETVRNEVPSTASGHQTQETMLL